MHLAVIQDDPFLSFVLLLIHLKQIRIKLSSRSGLRDAYQIVIVATTGSNNRSTTGICAGNVVCSQRFLDLIIHDEAPIRTTLRLFAFDAHSPKIVNKISAMDPRSGKFRAGQDHIQAKLTETQVKAIRLKKEGRSNAEGVSPPIQYSRDDSLADLSLSIMEACRMSLEDLQDSNFLSDKWPHMSAAIDREIVDLTLLINSQFDTVVYAGLGDDQGQEPAWVDLSGFNPGCLHDHPGGPTKHLYGGRSVPL